MRRFAVICVAVLFLAACGEDEVDVGAEGGSPGDTAGASAPPDDAVRYTASTTVLESPDHGPQLCLGGVGFSLPPQCGGPDIIGWDWEAIDGWESQSGTTWGSYRVVGTYEDGVFTLTERPEVAEHGDLTGDQPLDFTTPCPEPEGGWPTVTPEDSDVVAAYAQDQPDFAGYWVDDSGPTVLNVVFAGDVEPHRAAIAELWDGAVCLIEAERTEVELREILEELVGRDGFLQGWVDIVGNRVQIQVIVDDGTIQAGLDAAHGPGAVEVTSALRPVDEVTGPEPRSDETRHDDGSAMPDHWADFPSDEAREHARGLLGMSESDLDDSEVRIARRGDEFFILTDDYVLGRSTVELDDDGNGYRVVSVTVELPDQPETFGLEGG